MPEATRELAAAGNRSETLVGGDDMRVVVQSEVKKATEQLSRRAHRAVRKNFDWFTLST